MPGSMQDDGYTAVRYLIILVPKVLYWYPKYYTGTQSIILVPKVLLTEVRIPMPGSMQDDGYKVVRYLIILVPKVLYWYPKFYYQK